MERLLVKLDIYNGLPRQDREAFEEALWTELGEYKTVLILDMSGFSRIARTKGIVFYLAMIRRMQHTTAPLVASHSGRVVKFEADNLFAIFETPASAINCAIHINQELHAANLKLDDEAASIRVSIGIETGKILLVPGKDLFGDCVNIAAKLGEDLAEPSEILIAERAAERLPDSMKQHLAAKTFRISGVEITALSIDLSDGRDPGIELFEGTPLD